MLGYVSAHMCVIELRTSVLLTELLYMYLCTHARAHTHTHTHTHKFITLSLPSRYMYLLRGHVYIAEPPITAAVYYTYMYHGILCIDVHVYMFK